MQWWPLACLTLASALAPLLWDMALERSPRLRAVRDTLRLRRAERRAREDARGPGAFQTLWRLRQEEALEAAHAEASRLREEARQLSESAGAGMLLIPGRALRPIQEEPNAEVSCGQEGILTVPATAGIAGDVARFAEAMRAGAHRPPLVLRVPDETPRARRCLDCGTSIPGYKGMCAVCLVRARAQPVPLACCGSCVPVRHGSVTHQVCHAGDRRKCPDMWAEYAQITSPEPATWHPGGTI